MIHHKGNFHKMMNRREKEFSTCDACNVFHFLCIRGLNTEGRLSQVLFSKIRCMLMGRGGGDHELFNEDSMIKPFIKTHICTMYGARKIN